MKIEKKGKRKLWDFSEPKENYAPLGIAYKKYPVALLLNEADLESSYFFDI